MTLAAAPAEPELMVGHAPKLGKKHHHEQNEGYGSFFLHHMDKRWEEFQNDKLCNNERALDNHFDVCVFHSLQVCQIYSPQLFGFQGDFFNLLTDQRSAGYKFRFLPFPFLSGGIANAKYQIPIPNLFQTS